MHVIFVEPVFPGNQRRFPHALKEAGAKVSAIGEVPANYLDDETKRVLDDYEQVPSVVHEGALLEAVRRLQSRSWVDRLEATVEAHILPVARVREACGIPGTSYRTAYLCRDKPAMKEALREAGIPTAQSTGADSAQEVEEFVERVGYPVILKPRSAAGASGAYRADDPKSLHQAMEASGLLDGHSVAVEEFIEGHEGFYDTLSIDGEITHDFISHYYPNVLEAMRERWVNPYLITTNRMDAPAYTALKEMGARVNEALGIGTSATHMEWFYGPKGLKFSEIGCRPPGVRVWDIYSEANDFDLYREWAMAVTRGHATKAPSRRYAGALLNLRPERDGRIVAYEGLDQVQREVGEWIIDYHLPPVGSGTAPFEGGYMVNAWMRIKHPDYDQLRAICDWIGRTVRTRVQ